MTSRTRPADQGAADATSIAAELGKELVIARRAAGISQRAVAHRAGMSPSQLSRLERGKQQRPKLDLMCRAARAIGLVVTCKAYPDGTRVRDAASLALLGRLDKLLAASLRTEREVSLPIPGDQRAWDERIFAVDHSRASVEAETHIYDVQATARRIALKQRDDRGAGVVILLLNRTAHNRRVLAEHREALRGQFPLDGAAILRALRAGRIPPASGILML
jgi:transcriptional regulator with XRE-family HTH domain